MEIPCRAFRLKVTHLQFLLLGEATTASMAADVPQGSPRDVASLVDFSGSNIETHFGQVGRFFCLTQLHRRAERIQQSPQGIIRNRPTKRTATGFPAALIVNHPLFFRGREVLSRKSHAELV